MRVAGSRNVFSASLLSDIGIKSFSTVFLRDAATTFPSLTTNSRSLNIFREIVKNDFYPPILSFEESFI